MDSASSPLLTQPIRRALLTMAAPTAVGMLLTFLFQLVDTYFIGQLGVNELTAISFSYPIYILIIGLFMGLSTGVSAAVGKLLGEGNTPRAASLIAIAIISVSVVAILVGVLGTTFLHSSFSLLGTPAGLSHLVSEYMLPLYTGLALLAAVLVGNAALMAKGVMIKPMLVMGIGGLINLVLDYVLIFGLGDIPAMGLSGAAWATVISWFIMLILMILLLIREELIALPRNVKSIDIKNVLSLSIPAVAAQILTPISVAIITRIVSGFGDNAVAAYGIVARIESLALTGILALSVIITPLVAQNYGAAFGENKSESRISPLRLDNIVALSGRMTVYWGMVVYVALLLLGKPIIGLFTDNADIIQIGYLYIAIVGLSFPAFGLVLITSSFFNGVQKPIISLKLTLVKALLFSVPFALIGALFSAPYIWIGLAIANISGAIYAKALLDKWLTEHQSSLTEDEASIVGDYLNDMKAIIKMVLPN
ncbi:MATE family efflux transporter [Enterovibrio calviensis]|uniref:MATE family efflux transporter n=1 Tax=Enterovibrio calviensis TaxID=91359 RepID=UPI0004828A18|nr:MATE family efflux transporter [Enterovibrio calviensis]